MQHINLGWKERDTIMTDEQAQILFKQIVKTMKNINLKDGDFLSFTDEHKRVNISPYRVTLEMRFPNGIDQIDQ